MKKNNKTKGEIEALHAKIAPLQKRIYDIEEQEVLKVQRPRLYKMVGLCLKSTYENDNYYGRVLDLIENKKGSIYFILEISSITKEGNPYLHLDSASPYLNKEWWDTEFPVSGWKVCSEDEYQDFRSRISAELATQKSLRAWIKKLKY